MLDTWTGPPLTDREHEDTGDEVMTLRQYARMRALLAPSATAAAVDVLVAAERLLDTRDSAYPIFAIMLSRAAYHVEQDPPTVELIADNQGLWGMQW